MSRQAGFTLLEMLIALMILGMATASLTHTAWIGSWAARQGWSETAALRLAQSMAAQAGSALAVPPSGVDVVPYGLPYRVHIDTSTTSDGTTVFRIDVRAADSSPQILATISLRPMPELAQ